MKCPVCQKPTVSFVTWWTAGPFELHCPHCKVALKAGPATRRWYIAAFVSLATLFIAVITLQELGHMDARQGRLVLRGTSLLAFFACYSMAYVAGEYVKNERAVTPPRAPKLLILAFVVMSFITAVDLIRYL